MFLVAEGLGASDLTTAKISPIVADITVILNEVVTDLKVLIGQEAAIVLATVDKTALVTLHDLAIIVSELVHVSIFTLPLSYF